MADPPPLLSALTTAPRHIHHLLRCISFASKAHVRLSPEGIRFTTEQGSAMEAFVFLDKNLFSTYTYNAPAEESDNDNATAAPIFEINLTALLEVLNIFALSDPSTASGSSGSNYKRPSPYESFRLNRHAGAQNGSHAFSTPAFGLTALCNIFYAREGEPLRISLTSNAGVTTTCDLTTYESARAAMAGGGGEDEIPFDRDALALKCIMPSSCLLDAVAEVGVVEPANLSIRASPLSPSTSRLRGGAGAAAKKAANLELAATGTSGEASVEFFAASSSVPSAASDTAPVSDTQPVLETFQCAHPTQARFNFGLIKAARPAMAAARKVSMRVDAEGVLSLQFLVEVEEAGKADGSGVAFVDFRVVPLAEDEEEAGDLNEGDGESTEEE